MSHETPLDIPVPLVYNCMTLFTALGSLDKLSDPVVYHPGSEAYNQYAMAQSPPFRLVAEVRSSSSLGPICMDVIFDVPYMAVVKGNDQIMIKNLTTNGYSTITCKSYDALNEVSICIPVASINMLMGNRITRSSKSAFYRHRPPSSSSAESKTNTCCSKHTRFHGLANAS